MESIKRAYEEKDVEELKNYLSPAIAGDILNSLPYITSELTFTAKLVTIKTATVEINTSWRGTWITREGNITEQGTAEFVLDRESMNLLGVDFDNPFRFPGMYPSRGDREVMHVPSVKGGLDESELTQAKAPPVLKPGKNAGQTLSEPRPVTGIESSAKTYFIQVGAWINREYAEEALTRLKPYYPDAYIFIEKSGLKVFNKVRIPGIISKEQGRKIAGEIEERSGMKPIVRPEKQE